MVVRGVPHRIAKDAWWMDDTDPPIGLRAGPVLIVALVLGDAQAARLCKEARAVRCAHLMLEVALCDARLGF